MITEIDLFFIRTYDLTPKMGKLTTFKKIFVKWSYVDEPQHWSVHEGLQRLFTSSSFRRCGLMLFCEGPILLTMYKFLWLTVVQPFQTTKGFSDFGLSSRLVLPYLKCLKHFCATGSMTVPLLSTLISFVAALALSPFIHM